MKEEEADPITSGHPRPQSNVRVHALQRSHLGLDDVTDPKRFNDVVLDAPATRALPTLLPSFLTPIQVGERGTFEFPAFMSPLKTRGKK